jgi:hypothetical protein
LVNSGGCSEDQNAYRNADDSCALEVASGSKTSTEDWILSHAYDILTKNCLHFIHVLRHCGRLSFQVMDYEEKSRYSKTVTWLLLAVLSKLIVTIRCKRQNRKTWSERAV